MVLISAAWVFRFPVGKLKIKVILRIKEWPLPPEGKKVVVNNPVDTMTNILINMEQILRPHGDLSSFPLGGDVFHFDCPEDPGSQV